MGTTSRWGRLRPGGSVHPHARGDHNAKITPASTAAGSPPRPWGPQNQTRHSRRILRFTPTPVGTTAGRRCVHPATPVHPHARGDHSSELLGEPNRGGSPPRPWGPPEADTKRVLDIRFTPTPVGTTMTARPKSRPAPVHPHARGDHRTWFSTRSQSPGSPPRPWGPLPRDPPAPYPVRFTPTPVGTTGMASSSWVASSVHPHARGTTDAATSRRLPGTVHPHARGDHLVQRSALARAAGSPPRRGTTSASNRTETGMSVHPHARGDHSEQRPYSQDQHGSPPRPWGPHQTGPFGRVRRRFTPTPVGPPPRTDQAGCRSRFTPTPVGTTSTSPARSAVAPVHPHARGDHTSENPGGVGDRSQFDPGSITHPARRVWDLDRPISVERYGFVIRPAGKLSGGCCHGVTLLAFRPAKEQ